MTIVEPVDGAEVVGGSTVRVVAGATDDLGVAAVAFRVDGLPAREDTEAPFELALPVPADASSLFVAAQAEDALGATAVAPEIELVVIPDPGATLVGTVVEADGTPVAGATVSALEVVATSGGDGGFVLEGVPSIEGEVVVTATVADPAGERVAVSSPVQPAPDALVDVGSIVLLARTGVLGMVADDETDSVTVFDAATGVVVGSVPVGPGSAIGDCSITPDGSLGFVTNFARELWVIDLATRPPSLAAGPNPIPITNPGEDTSVTPDGRFLVVCDGGSPDPLAVVDVASREVVSTFRLSEGCNSVEVCNDELVLVTGRGSDEIVIFSLAGDGRISFVESFVGFRERFQNGVCRPDGTGFVLTGSQRDDVWAFTMPGLRIFGNEDLGGTSAVSAVLHPTEDRILVRDNGGFIASLDYDPLLETLAAPVLVAPIEPGRAFFGIDQMALGPDGRKLYVSQPGALAVHDVDTGELLDRIVAPSIVSPTGVCFPRRERTGTR